MEHKLNNVELIFKLTEEKKLEKTYTAKNADVTKCINDTAKRMLETKYRIKDNSIEQKLVLSADLPFIWSYYRNIYVMLSMRITS
jgi:hypothetical protein